MADGPKLSAMKYLVEAVIRSDDDGTVMRIGDQGSLGTRYALKTIKRDEPEDDFKLALGKAAVEASAKLGFPSILVYHDYRVQRSLFTVKRAEVLMEYVSGRSLDRIEGADMDQWTLIFLQVAAALAHMHRRGVLHGDLTPARVLLARSGRAKVFGYGRPGAGEPAKPRPSLAYVAPEVMKSGTVDEKAEVYALGATFYHLMTGRSANAGNRAVGEGGKIPTPRALNPAIPMGINNLLINCLQSSPSKRPEAVYDVVRTLETIVKEQGLDEGKLRGLAIPED